MLLLDVEGAFPNAVTDKLIHNLKKRRAPTAIVNFVKVLLTGRRTKLKFDDYTLDTIPILNGIGQGDPLSMLLYIFYNADLLDLPDNPTSEDAIGYIDDIALVAIRNDFEESTNRLKDMMTKEDGGISWSKTHNSRFEVTKSAILHFSRKTTRDPDSENGRISLPKPALTLEGQLVQDVASFRYLGIHIDTQLKWKEQAQHATANATKWILQFRHLTKPSTGVGAKLMQQLYLAVALPKITYGVDIWYTPPTKPPGYTKNKGSVGILRNLQKTQRIAALEITGTLRTTPNDFIDVHAGIFPIELALLKACHNAITRTLTLPDTHPLHSITTYAKRRPPNKHLSPIDTLIKQFNLRHTTLEMIQPTVCINNNNRNYSTKTESNREDSIHFESLDNADFKIYTDGSGHDNGIGAAAILYAKGRARHMKSLQAYLGSTDEHNTYEAEAIGLILPLWLLHNTPETYGKTVSIYSDNQSVISAITSLKASSGQYLLSNIHAMANRAACKLSIKWISGHSKVKGNEAADKLAKDAASGRSSARATLPHLLRSPLPRSVSATKQEYAQKLKAKWTALWNASPRMPRVAQFGEAFPFNSLRKKLYTLTRKHSSIILQIRSNHFPLNKYLHKINKADTDNCQCCAELRNGAPAQETINHFIFECPAHTEYRNELTAKTGRRHFNLPDIMSNADFIKALVTYINRTSRFRS